MGLLAPLLTLAVTMAQGDGKQRIIIGTNDYPRAALREGRGGSVGWRLTVGEDGKVMRCDVALSSGFDDLDRRTCDLYQKRTRFRPALDNAGQPTVMVFRGFTNWSLPGGRTYSPPPGAVKPLEGSIAEMPVGLSSPLQLQLAFEVDDRGVVSHCTPVLLPYGSPEAQEQAKRAVSLLGSDACAIVLANYKSEPATDNQGRPIKSIQTTNVMFDTQANPK